MARKNFLDLIQKQRSKRKQEKFSGTFLQYLERSLVMMEDGTFGICKKCKCLIDKERLIELGWLGFSGVSSSFSQPRTIKNNIDIKLKFFVTVTLYYLKLQIILFIGKKCVMT